MKGRVLNCHCHATTLGCHCPTKNPNIEKMKVSFQIILEILTAHGSIRLINIAISWKDSIGIATSHGCHNPTRRDPWYTLDHSSWRRTNTESRSRGILSLSVNTLSYGGWWYLYLPFCLPLQDQSSITSRIWQSGPSRNSFSEILRRKRVCAAAFADVVVVSIIGKLLLLGMPGFCHWKTQTTQSACFSVSGFSFIWVNNEPRSLPATGHHLMQLANFYKQDKTNSQYKEQTINNKP